MSLLKTHGLNSANTSCIRAAVSMAFFTMLWATASHAVTPGTAINHDAQTSYSVGGFTGISTAPSAAPTLTVVTSGVTDAAGMTITTPATQHVYAADAVSINVAVSNAGTNTLATAELRVTLPVDVVPLLDAASPGSSVPAGAQTVHTFAVADLPTVTTANYTLDLTMPATVDPANNTVSVEYFANAASRVTKSVDLDLSNRTAVDVISLQYNESTPSHNYVVDVTEYDTTGAGVFANLPAPAEVTGMVLPLQSTSTFSHSQSMYLRVADMDHNTDSSIREKVTLTFTVDTGDSEALRLLETGVDTGIFTGYANIAAYGAAVTANNGELDIAVNSNVTISYTDPQDAGDVLDLVIIVDPYGKVFNSVTGDPMVGYTVHMINVDTGLPATVIGDDGINGYPASMVTGDPDDPLNLPQDTKGLPVTDDGGTVYSFEKGAYRFPFAPVANYKLVVVPPDGAQFTWPSKKTDEQLQQTEKGTWVIVNGSRGESFYLPAGPPLNIDIPVDPTSSAIHVRRTASKDRVAAGDFIQFRVEVENLTNGTAFSDVVLTDSLPAGFKVQQESARYQFDSGSMQSVPASQISYDGDQLVFSFTDSVNTKLVVEYVAAVGAVKQGVANSTSKATATAGAKNLTSNTAELVTRLEEDLFRSRAILMGSVVSNDEPAIGVKGVRIYMEDGRYAITDEKGNYHFDNVLPGTHVVQVDMLSLPEAFELLPDSDQRGDTASVSRFVDLQGGTLWRSDFNVRVKEGFDLEKLNAPSSRYDWRKEFPGIDEIVSIPSATIAIEHFPEESVTLYFEEQPVSEKNFDGISSSEAGATVSTWSGVDIQPGKNEFVVVIKDQNQKEVSRRTRNIVFSDFPVTAELVEEASTLIADGVTKPVVALRLKDKDGYPARPGVVGEFRLDSNHRLAQQTKFAQMNMPGVAAQRLEYVVEEGGLARITLEPVSESGDVKLRIPLSEGVIKELNAPLKSQAREWIVVGLAEGTQGFNTLKGNMQPLTGNQAKETYQDGRFAFFAKGKVSGKWLLTLAYDSAKERGLKQDPNHFQSIDPNKYYTLYGDTGYQGYGAPSSEKLYLRLENDEFFFMFGDYETGLNQTELSKYNRIFTGVKSRYRDGLIDVIVFGSESYQAYVRDQIRGEGSSGPYQLSRELVSLNTEQVVIEVRDRFQSQTVVEARTLTRHVDYDIDYQAGTVLFRQPIFSTDASLNPKYIVVTYEAYDQTDKTITSGGRGEIAITEKTKLGVTAINEGRVGGNAQMQGVDLRIQAGENIQIRAEVAQSQDNKLTAAHSEGKAYKVEINHRSAAGQTKVYVREQQRGFGLGQISSTEAGRRKIGAEASTGMGNRFTVKAKATHEEELPEASVNDPATATRDLVEAEGRYNFDSASLSLGTRSVQDIRRDGTEQRSDQVTAGAKKSFGRLALRIDREQNLDNASSNSIDYPDRTLLGMDYQLGTNSALFVEQEIADGDARDTTNTQAGIKSQPWQGGSLFAGVKQAQDNDAVTNSASLAVKQKWQISKAWSMDFGAEETRTLDQVNSTASDPLTGAPYASGPATNSSDYTASSVAATYAPGDWLWTTRVENRVGSSENSAMFGTSIQSSPDVDLSTLASLQLSNREQATGDKYNSATATLGAAYRPADSRWLLLNKLQLHWADSITDSYTDPLTKVVTSSFSSEEWRWVNNLNLNYSPNKQWQLAMQWGTKSVKETIADIDYESTADLIGLETRYNITRSWDVGLHGNALHVWNTKQNDYSAGVSVGHVIAKNIWISLGYNAIGFWDKDFSKTRYTSQGAFLKFRMKFDQETFRGAKAWLGR